MWLFIHSDTAYNHLSYIGTHFPIAIYAIERGIHVLVTKPATQLLSHHNALIAAAKKHNVVCFVEHHKRWTFRFQRSHDNHIFSFSEASTQCTATPRPVLQLWASSTSLTHGWVSPKANWRLFVLGLAKILTSGLSGFQYSFVTINRYTFRSYYLSSHHIDICCWILQDTAIPTRVVASAATGIATSEPYNCVPQTEDTITLMVDWQSIKSAKHRGTGVYTASWTAPLKAGVHSAQHWYYMGEKVSLAVMDWLATS